MKLSDYFDALSIVALSVKAASSVGLLTGDEARAMVEATARELQNEVAATAAATAPFN